MPVLVIDAALSRCAVAIADLEADTLLATRDVAMERGHAETLVPQVDTVMSKAGIGWRSLDRIAVVTGPGSFTGIRVGVAAAKAFGLVAGCPVIGVSLFEAVRLAVAPGGNSGVAVAQDARRGDVYMQVFGPDGAACGPPALVSVPEAARWIAAWLPEAEPATAPPFVVGTGAGMITAHLPPGNFSHAEAVAHDYLAIARFSVSRDPEEYPPSPLYIRPPDAKPQQRAGVLRLRGQ